MSAAENAVLREFARECLAGYRDGSVGDLDGGWLQEKAIELGLLVECGTEGELYRIAGWLDGGSEAMSETRTLEEIGRELRELSQLCRCGRAFAQRLLAMADELAALSGSREPREDAASQRIAQLEQERDKWKGRARAFRVGRINEMARGTAHLLNSTVDKRAREKAEQRIAELEQRLQQPVRTGCDDCLDARREAEAKISRLREALTQKIEEFSNESQRLRNLAHNPEYLEYAADLRVRADDLQARADDLSQLLKEQS